MRRTGGIGGVNGIFMPVLIFNFIAYSNSNNIINNFKRRYVNDRNLQGHIVKYLRTTYGQSVP